MIIKKTKVIVVLIVLSFSFTTLIPFGLSTSTTCASCGCGDECFDIILDSIDGCFHMESASNEYLSEKLEKDVDFKTLFDYANELGFTRCIGKWLVTSKKNDKQIGFMGFRVNDQYSQGISLLSFDQGRVKAILMNFSTEITEFPTIRLFNRNGGIIVENNSLLDAWGEAINKELNEQNLNFKYLFEKHLDYLNNMAKFLTFRFNDIKIIFDNWLILEAIEISEEQFINNIRDYDLYNFMEELGYNNFIQANKTIFKNGHYMMVGAYTNDNNNDIFLIDTVNRSLLLKFENFGESSATMTLFDRDDGATFNLTNFQIIEAWGIEYNSCSYDRCYYACLMDWFNGFWGWACRLICGTTCAACLSSLISPEPFSKTLCVACGVCLAACLGVPFAVCAGACAIDACDYGHVCRPGTIRNRHCADYYAGYYHTLIWEECNSIGMGWVTHYDYCGSRGLICDPSTLVCKVPGDGGCPTLFVHDGTGYISEGLLDIHNLDGEDILTYHILETRPESINNNYYLKLEEHPLTISYIDNVRLYVKLPYGRLINLPLLFAEHSNLGDVKDLLRVSDNIRVTELGADHNGGISESIELVFLGPKNLPYIEFIFFIEGYNAYVK